DHIVVRTRVSVVAGITLLTEGVRAVVDAVRSADEGGVGDGSAATTGARRDFVQIVRAAVVAISGAVAVGVMDRDGARAARIVDVVDGARVVVITGRARLSRTTRNTVAVHRQNREARTDAVRTDHIVVRARVTIIACVTLLAESVRAVVDAVR